MHLSPSLLRDAFATACVFAACNALLVLVSTLRARLHYCPETTRKLLHIGMGLLALTYPFVFTSALPVLLINATFLLLLTLGRCSSVGRTRPSDARLRAGTYPSPEQTRSACAILRERFQDHWHDLTCRIPRKTVGEFYFPLAVALLFLLANGDPLLFCIPLLILTIADAAAALIGCNYGLHPYRTAAGRKSLEGSAAFLLCTFLLTEIPLLFIHLPPGTAIFIALTLAASMTLIEALSWRGLDNLLLPLTSFALLSLLLRAAA